MYWIPVKKLYVTKYQACFKILQQVLQGFESVSDDFVVEIEDILTRNAGDVPIHLQNIPKFMIEL